MKYLSRQGIEQIGERVIMAYRNLPDNKKSTLYRVDPIKLIEEVLKVNLEYHHLSLSIIVFVFCVDNQSLFSSGMRLIVTVFCIAMIAFGIWFLARKKQ